MTEDHEKLETATQPQADGAGLVVDALRRTLGAAMDTTSESDEAGVTVISLGDPKINGHVSHE